MLATSWSKSIWLRGRPGNAAPKAWLPIKKEFKSRPSDQHKKGGDAVHRGLSEFWLRGPRDGGRHQHRYRHHHCNALHPNSPCLKAAHLARPNAVGR